MGSPHRDPASTAAGREYPRPGDHAPRLGGVPTGHLTGREPTLSRLRAALTPVVVHVDDDAMMRRLVARILEANGYRTLGFGDGAEALDYCRRSSPALLITDIQRPGMDGATLCRMIRREPALRTMSLIILSAYGPLDLYPLPDEVGAVHISKPCDIADFLAEVRLAVATWRQNLDWH